MPRKRSWNIAPQGGTGTVGIILHGRRLEHFHEGDAHALGDGGYVLHDSHIRSSITKGGGFRYAGVKRPETLIDDRIS